MATTVRPRGVRLLGMSVLAGALAMTACAQKQKRDFVLRQNGGGMSLFERSSGCIWTKPAKQGEWQLDHPGSKDADIQRNCAAVLKLGAAGSNV